MGLLFAAHLVAAHLALHAALAVPAHAAASADPRTTTAATQPRAVKTALPSKRLVAASTTRRTAPAEALARTAPAQSVETVVEPCTQQLGMPASGDGWQDASGGYIVCGPDPADANDPGGTPAGDATEPAPEPADPYAGLRAYDVFPTRSLPAGHGEQALLQAHLLAAAAFYIYAPAGLEGDFEAHFMDTMEGFGLQAKFVESPLTDTQAGILWNDEIVIVTFRGTTPGMDFWTDAQQHMREMPETWGDGVLVHDGFAGAWESIRPMVLPEVHGLVSEGRSLWLTGHSLGAAVATLAAYELKQVLGLAPAGVHTFGSPRVGGWWFGERYDDIGLGGVTRRWVIAGDPIPTFFDDGLVLSCSFLSCTVGTDDFRHVGVTNNVLPSGPAPDFDYTLEPDGDDVEFPWWPMGALVEHIKYDDALDALLAEVADPALMAILPPVQVE